MALDNEKSTKSIHDGHRARLRERFRSNKESFQEHELLELLLGYSILRKDTNELAHNLINKFGSLENVLNASPETLSEVSGVGENTAHLLSLVGYLSKVSSGAKRKKVKLSTIESLKQFAKPLFQGADHEKFYVLFLDGAKNLLGYCLADNGSVNSVSIDFNTLSQNILIYKPKSVILVHNHLTSFPYPSQEDDRATAKIYSYLNNMKINLYDHLIVGSEDSYSYFYDNRLQKIKESVNEKF